MSFENELVVRVDSIIFLQIIKNSFDQKSFFFVRYSIGEGLQLNNRISIFSFKKCK